MLAVELRLDLAGEEDVGLLERMVVGLGRAAELVVDREHRHVVGAELVIDEHLHRDPAVHDERRVATGGRTTTGRVLDAQGLELLTGPVVVPDESERRVAERRPARGGVHRRQIIGGLEERVPPARIRRQPLRRRERQEPNGPGAPRAVPERVPEPGRHECVVATDESVDRPGQVEQQLALEHVQGFLEAVDVRREPAARSDRDRGKVRVHGALRGTDDRQPSEAERRGTGGGGLVGERPVDVTDGMHGPTRCPSYSNRRDQASTPTASNRMTPSVTC